MSDSYEEAMEKDPKQPKLEPCYTVGELIEQLKRLPSDLPVEAGFEDGVLPVVFNWTKPTVHLRLEENDGTWDDDDQSEDDDGDEA